MRLPSENCSIPEINFVPTFLPDELLYSFISRLHLLNCISNAKNTLKFLFDSSAVIPSIDLPSHLDTLQSKLGLFSPFSDIEMLAADATLYPYYKVFMSPDRSAHMLNSMRNDGMGLKTAIGLVANRFGASPELKACPKCWYQDIANHGTVYWHRSHHLPAVTYCAEHEYELVHFGIQSRLGNRHSLLRPWILQSSPEINSANNTASHRAIWFSKLSRDLLYSKLESSSPEQRRDIYWAGLKNKHLIRGHHQVFWGDLSNEIRQFYEDFHWTSYRERLLSTEKHPVRWLHDVIERPERAVHPICHLLLIGYLFDSISTYRNQLCNYELLKQADIKNAGLFKISETHRFNLIKDTNLSCRKAAEQLGVSTEKIVETRRLLGLPISERRKIIHPQKLEAIQHDLSKGLALSVITEKHAISTISVYRILRTAPEIQKSRKDMKKSLERNARRERWKNHVAENSALSATTIRKMAPDTYAWLYRNDWDWLKKQNHLLPSIARYDSSRKCIDWQQRDIDYTQKALALAQEIKKKKHRSRVTPSSILRSLGIEASVRHNKHSFNSLHTVLPTICENLEQYQILRIEQSIKDLATRYQALKFWKIKRIAGLKNWTPSLYSAAENIIVNLIEGRS